MSVCSNVDFIGFVRTESVAESVAVGYVWLAGHHGPGAHATALGNEHCYHVKCLSISLIGGNSLIGLVLSKGKATPVFGGNSLAIELR